MERKELSLSIARADTIAGPSTRNSIATIIVAKMKSACEARATGGKLIQQPYAFIQFPSLISALASCNRL